MTRSRERDERGRARGTSRAIATLALTSFVTRGALATPTVTTVTPSRGSIVGGTMVTIRGANLSPSNAATNASTPFSGPVRVFLGGALGSECVYNHYASNDTHIVCEAQSAVNGEALGRAWHHDWFDGCATRDASVWVFVDGVRATTASSATFSLDWRATTQIHDVQPRTASKGDRVRVSGHLCFEDEGEDETRRAGLESVDSVKFGEFECDLRNLYESGDDADTVEQTEDFEIVTGGGQREGRTLGNVPYRGCRYGEFSCRLPDDIAVGSHSISVHSKFGSADGSGSGDAVLTNRVPLSSGTTRKGYRGGEQTSLFTGERYLIEVVPGVSHVSVVDNRTITIHGMGLTSDMQVNLAEMTHYNVPCVVTGAAADGSHLNCTLPSSDPRTLGNIASLRGASGAEESDSNARFLSGLGGLVDERWGFVKGSNWRTHPFADIWKGSLYYSQWSPRVAITELRARGREASSKNLLVGAFDTSPFDADFPPTFGWEVLRTLSGFFIAPRAAMYRFPVDFDQSSYILYLNGTVYPGSSYDPKTEKTHGHLDALNWRFDWISMEKNEKLLYRGWTLRGLAQNYVGSGNVTAGVDAAHLLKDAPNVEAGDPFSYKQYVTFPNEAATSYAYTVPGSAYTLAMTGGGATGSISTTATSAEIAKEVSKLYAWRSCSETNPLGGGLTNGAKGYVTEFEQDLTSYERGNFTFTSGNTYTSREKFTGWHNGLLDFTTAACGRGSMKVVHENALVYENGDSYDGMGVSLGFDDVKVDVHARYLNFAYRIPTTSRAMMVLTFQVSNLGRDLGYRMNIGSLRFAKCAVPLNWAEFPEAWWTIPRCGGIVNLAASDTTSQSTASVVADDTWRSAVIDLKQYLESAGLSASAGDFAKVYLRGVSFHAPTVPFTGGCATGERCCGPPEIDSKARFNEARLLKGNFWIDEFSLSMEPRKLSMTDVLAAVGSGFTEDDHAVSNVVASVNGGVATISVAASGKCNGAATIPVLPSLTMSSGTISTTPGQLTMRSMTVSLAGPSVTGTQTASLDPYATTTSLATAINGLYTAPSSSPPVSVAVTKEVPNRGDTCSSTTLVIDWKRAVAFNSSASLLYPNATSYGRQPATSWDNLEYTHPAGAVNNTVTHDGVIHQFPLTHVSSLFHPISEEPHVVVRTAAGRMLACANIVDDGPCKTALSDFVEPVPYNQSVVSAPPPSTPGSPDVTSVAQPPTVLITPDGSPPSEVTNVGVVFGKRKLMSAEETIDARATNVDENDDSKARKFKRPKPLKEYTREQVDAMRAMSPGGHSGSYGELRERLGAHVPIDARRKLLTTSTGSGSGTLSWSSTSTWGGAVPTSSNTDIVYIPNGVTVEFDVASASIDFWIIEGTLLFKDTQDIAIEAKAIIVNHEDAKFLVGDASNAFTHKFDLKLRGTWGSYALPKFGIKTLAMTNGTMVLHGKEVSPTWTVLNANARVGDNRIRVVGRTNWQAGDAIVVATTAQGSLKMRCLLDRTDTCESEERNITSIAYDSDLDETTITLGVDLKYDHLGVLHTDSESGKTIEMRAEVIHLTRNVKVHGSTEAASFGSHIMVLSGKVIWKYFEHTYAGQKFQMGRYATHIHTVGQDDVVGGSDQSHSIVQGLSIHKSFNRAITAHGCHNVKFYDNVAYNVLGHMYFIEDGVETGNNYTRNVGIMAHRSYSLLNSDQTPAIFWITHPSNYFYGNRAVASHFHGFWFDVKAGGQPLGAFDDNVAHSNGKSGIWATNIDATQSGARIPTRLVRANMWGNPFGMSFIHGIGHVQVVDSTFASNNAHLDFWWMKGDRWWSTSNANAPLVERCVFFGSSPLGGGRSAIQLPFSGFLTVRSPTFVGYGWRSPVRSCGTACRGVGGGTESRWIDVRSYSQRAPIISWLKHGGHNIMYDVDGSLTGEGTPHFVHRRALGSGGVGYFPAEHCRIADRVNGVVCNASSVSLRTFQMNKASEFEFMGLTVTTAYGTAGTKWFKYDHMPGRIENHALTLVMTKRPAKPIVHEVTFNAPAWKRQDLYEWVAAEARELLEDEWAVIRLQTTILPDSVQTKSASVSPAARNGYVKTTQTNATWNASWTGFNASDLPGDWAYIPGPNVSNYGKDGRFDMLVSGKIKPPQLGTINAGGDGLNGVNEALPFCDVGAGACSSSPKMSYGWRREDCDPIDPSSNCLVANFSLNCLEDEDGPEAEATTRVVRWCDSYTGTNRWSPPADGADAVIPEGLIVYLDETCNTTGNLRWLDIYGELHVLDGTYVSGGGSSDFVVTAPSGNPRVTISAEVIHIAARSSRLVIGTENSPIEKTFVTVQLHGNVDNVARSASRNLKLPPSKFIFVMGELSMHGTTQKKWTRLTRRADAGATTIRVDKTDYSTATMFNSLIGERVVVAASGLNVSETEVRKVTAVTRSTGTLTLDQPLSFDHSGPYDGTYSKVRGIPAAEVGVLGDAFNIRVTGALGAVEEQKMGASILVHLAKLDADANKNECGSDAERAGSLQGSARLQNVKFDECGQAEFTDGRGACVSFYGSFNYGDDPKKIGAPGYVKGCVFESSHNTAVHAVGYNNVLGLTIVDNFVYDARAPGGALYVSGSFGKVEKNLIAGARGATREHEGIGIYWAQGRHPAAFDKNKTWFANNVVAGAGYAGIITSGFSCAQFDDPYVYGQFEGNVVHTIGPVRDGPLGDDETIVGAGLLIQMTTFRMRRVRNPLEVYGSASRRCGAHHGYVIYSVNSYGISSYDAAQTTWMSDMLVYNAKIGFHAWNVGGNALAHECRADDHFLLRRSRFVGDVTTCGQIGVIPGVFYNSLMPFRVSPFGGNSPSSCGSTVLSDVEFVDYGVCDDGVTRSHALSNAVRGTPSDFTVDLELYDITFTNVVDASKLSFVAPPLSGVQRDATTNFKGTCAQFACDGLRATVIRDRTGSLLSGVPGTIIARGNERRWDDALLYTDPEGRRTMRELIPARARWPMLEQDRTAPLTDAELYDSVGVPRDGCAYVADWDAYSCPGGRHRRLVFENMDADTKRRRIFPLGVVARASSGSNRYMSLYTGPAAYGGGWALRIERLSTAVVVVVVGGTHEFYTAGSHPKHLRLRLLDASADEAVVARVLFATPNIVNIYVNGELKPQLSNVTLKTRRLGEIPTRLDPEDPQFESGAGYYDRTTGFLEVVVRGNAPVDLKVSNRVLLTVNSTIDEDEFYNSGSDGLVKNIADLLDIPEDRVAVAGFESSSSAAAASRQSRRALRATPASVPASMTFTVDPAVLAAAADLRAKSFIQLETSADIEIEDAVALERVPVNERVENAQTLASVDERETAYDDDLRSLIGNIRYSLRDAAGKSRLVENTGASASALNFSVGDIRTIPALWECDDARYDDGETCDCDCGVWDPDCDSFPGAENEFALGDDVVGCGFFDALDAAQVYEACAYGDVKCLFSYDDDDGGDVETRPNLAAKLPSMEKGCARMVTDAVAGTPYADGMCALRRSSPTGTPPTGTPPTVDPAPVDPAPVNEREFTGLLVGVIGGFLAIVVAVAACVRRRIWNTVNASMSSALSPEERVAVNARGAKGGKVLFGEHLRALSREAPRRDARADVADAAPTRKRLFGIL